jgi:hypothetical protein
VGLTRVPPVLRHQLGEEASAGLVELFDLEQRAWSDEVLSAAADRFERVLTPAISALRVDLAHVESRIQLTLRQELHEGLTNVRQEQHDGLTSVRQELREGLTSVRQELREGLTSVRQELAETRVELLKWSFLFWLGQVAAIGSLLAFMLRVTGR